ncbi:CLUMA_CG019917, isoform A [Clunio marinus]|uniref:CLUMA_CG019917, isoform A n=1 Tax=Clunio marinus TaxID=568069 RepID=A0A1J1J539_9DIPT|nr:CLUMA_CG019917, isoform A [Clunio marinus]
MSRSIIFLLIALKPFSIKLYPEEYHNERFLGISNFEGNLVDESSHQVGLLTRASASHQIILK